MKKKTFVSTIAAGLLAVFATIFTPLLLFRKKKVEDNAKPTPQTVDDLIAQFGEPDDFVLLDATRGNEAGGVLLVYDDEDVFVINGEKVRRSDIIDVTFNNNAVAYLPNEYHVIIKMKDDSESLHLMVGNDGKWAMQVVEQITHHLNKQR